MNVVRTLSRTKLYWGLLLICLIGALASPHTSSGRNIFLSYANLTDVLRQVSITGLVATGMTMVILLGGIDLSVGSMMGFSTIICAMLLTKSGWTAASIMGLPAITLVSCLAVAFLARFVFNGLARGRDVSAGQRRKIVLDKWRSFTIPALLGVAFASAAAWFAAAQVPTKFGVIGVLLVTPCVALVLGSVNGVLIVAGRLQPFIATLAMMVSALGIGRLTAGQNNAVIAVYTGTNATDAFESLRSMVWGVLPMPSVFFLAAITIFGAILRFTTFGRYVYAIGGNLEAAKLSGIKVAQVQFTAYLLSGLLAGIAGVLFVAQYRQGKPDAGSGLELDAIAAVVIGGTSLMGGRGGLAGTFVGVLIFGLLSDILQLENIDSNVQLVMKGLIIVCTVLVQEQNLGQLLTRRRIPLPSPAPSQPGSAEFNRPRSASNAPIVREDFNEAS
jgi:simple sugar transport system permease protein